jgi:hypothetical protein
VSENALGRTTKEGDRMLGTKAVRRVLVTGALAVGLGFGTAVTAASGASAAGPPISRGTCSIGDHWTANGAFGCAGNVGGFIATPNGNIVCPNHGPFTDFPCPPF